MLYERSPTALYITAINNKFLVSFCLILTVLQRSRFHSKEVYLRETFIRDIICVLVLQQNFLVCKIFHSLFVQLGFKQSETYVY